MTDFKERLEALKTAGVISGWQAPQPNRGLAGGRLPWVIMPMCIKPATTYYTEASLHQAITVLEQMGPMLLRNPISAEDRRF